MPLADDDRIDLIFKALASGPRRQILALLASAAGAQGCCASGEVCACVFSRELGLGAPTVSHHMKALLDAGLVTAEKRGLWVYYRMRPSGWEPVLGEMARLGADPAAG